MKGFLFKPWKIQFIAEHPDMEIQTRRVIKPQPKYLKGDKYSQWFWCKKDISEVEAMQSGMSYAIWWDEVKTPRVMTAFSRYQQGETVYIKEAWRFYDDRNQISDGRIDYKADYAFHNGDKYKWRSPLFMPEWAARHFRMITDVRAERLQEITWEDVLREGIGHRIAIHNPKWMLTSLFSSLWNSINKDYPWESNPYVFSYTFRQEIPIKQ